MRWPATIKPWPQLDPARRPQPLIWLIDRRCHALVAQAAVAASPCSRGGAAAGSSRLRRDDDRDRSLAGRGHCALVLGGLIGQEPRHVPLDGGPRRQNPSCRSGFSPSFNISHSAPWCCWPSRHCPVGVDGAPGEPGLRWQTIARRCFDPALCRQSEAARPSKQRLAFLRHWCRLEPSSRPGEPASVAPPLHVSASHRPPRAQLPECYAGAVAMVCRLGLRP